MITSTALIVGACLLVLVLGAYSLRNGGQPPPPTHDWNALREWIQQNNKRKENRRERRKK